MYDPWTYLDNEIELAMNKYHNMVYRIAMNQVKNQHDADDIFQEVFVRYITAIGREQLNKKTFESEEHKKAWLIRVTLNCCNSFLTSAWSRKIVPLKEDIPFETKEEGDVFEAVMKLPLKYRTVIHLFYYEDLPVAEISQLLDRKESTVREQLTRARRLLKKSLKGDYDYV